MRTALLSIALCTLLGSCREHFIPQSAFRQEVAAELAARQERFPCDERWRYLDTARMTRMEREAMQFLYASMSIADFADYDGAFYLANTRQALLSKAQMAWGSSVPEDLFRHFVLPVRVNNENLDDFRTTYYEELKARVADRSLYDAALEINHWCHEKVSYTPSDSRTSSPSATVRTAQGRCGEESTLTVAALRTVCIPARQVYTPRWAHTDDNHAWVEVWVDGKWYFLGACEPEPVLNKGWFNAPAARAMLMHTCVFGRYHGTEDEIRRTPCFTEINVIGNYVPTRRSKVRVVGHNGQPVAGATVEFRLYNYAELYPVVRLQSDAQGEVSLTTGLGDMVVWATAGERFGYARLDRDTLTVQLNHRQGDLLSEDFDLTPPAEGEIPCSVTEEQESCNKARLAEEDRIREAYKATFLTADKARSLGYNTEQAELLAASQGNWQQIKAFFDRVPANRQADALLLLNHISAKDLRDTPAACLLDHLLQTPPQTDPLYGPYVLSPRIADELLTPFRSVLSGQPELPSREAAQDDPQTVVNWCREHLAPADDYNPGRVPISPSGVWTVRAADRKSRHIFFVALCRTLGVPARIEPVTGITEYWKAGWHAVDFGEAATTQPPTGELALNGVPNPIVPDPTYYRHFTLARVDSTRMTLLNFEEGDATESGAEASLKTLFRKPYPLAEGYYMLTTGSRMASGKVLAHIELFNIGGTQTTTVPLVLRRATDDISVLGNLDPEHPYIPVGTTTSVSLLSTTGRGYFMLLVAGAKDEPTTHATRALQHMASVLNDWNRPIVTLLRNEHEAALFDPARLSALNRTSYGIDPEGRIAEMLCQGCNAASRTLPIVVVADSFGRIVYFSQGYNTALEEQLQRTLLKL